MAEPESLTMAEAAVLLRFDATAPSNPVKAVRQWLHRQATPVVRRGRVLLVERRVLLAVVRQDTR
jgi:hypothetical protein